MLPLLNEHGDLPPGIHSADWAEIEARFGVSTPARVRAFNKLKVLYKLAVLTGKLKRFFVFGGFVSDKAEPRDVDVALIMDADFEVEHCPRESQTLFSHADADARFGASVFGRRPLEAVRGLLIEGFVRTVMIELLPEAIELALLCREIGRRRERGLGLERTMHPLMTTTNGPFI